MTIQQQVNKELRAYKKASKELKEIKKTRFALERHKWQIIKEEIDKLESN